MTARLLAAILLAAFAACDVTEDANAPESQEIGGVKIGSLSGFGPTDDELSPCFVPGDEFSTCTDWCEAQGMPCLYVTTWQGGECVEGGGLNHVGYCHADIVADWPAESVENIAIQCRCDGD